jgi:2-polyprenyl-3-methyl-5-hydroxy-6-metoxy-1,4-benzoquinol methylase
MIRRFCPICHSKTEKVFVRDFSEAASIVPFSKYDVMFCSQCGMLYAGNIVESMPLLNYYNIMSKYETDYYQDEKKDCKRYEREVKFLSTYVNRQADILDMGCAAGGLLCALQQAGYQYLTGIEPSEENVSLIKKKHNLEAYTGVLGGGKRPISIDKKFDLVILCNVLEHIMSLHEAIVDCLSYIKQGGMLYIEVPDMEQACDYPDLYQQFSVEHVNYFSLESLKHLCQSHELSLIAIQQISGQLYTIWHYDGNNSQHKEQTQHSKHIFLQYIAKASALTSHIKDKLETINKKEIYIWGAGTHTMMLYQLGLLKGIHVAGIIDANRNYEGKVIYGHQILYPTKNIEPDVIIVISTQYAQNEVKKDIRKKWGLMNPIVCLYE